MEKIIVVNQKIYLDTKNLKNYILKLEPYKDRFIICPSALHIPYFLSRGFITGVQNIYCKSTGAYTGEISPKQAKDLGVKYAMIGHQERRHIFDETNHDINLKVKEAQKNNLKVILCIGEEDKDSYKRIIKHQIQTCLENVKEEVLISYEPLWAIGTHNNASPDHIEEVTKYIKSLFSYDVKVLYGGSVDEESIKTLKEVKEVSGFLVGSASVNPDALINIREVV